jgi:long-chain acyl-CoA synthetase
LDRVTAIKELTAAGQPMELVDSEVNTQLCRIFKNGPHTLRQLYEQSLSDKTQIVFRDERYSYQDIWEKASKLAHVLRHDYGIEKGDRVAISMRNYPEWIIAFSAITSMGAVAVAMNSLWQPDEMAYGLKDSGAKLLFADEERLQRFFSCEDSPKINLVAVRTDAMPSLARWQELLDKTSPCDMPAVDLQVEDLATIFYTSGSTAHPKGVATSHINITSALLSWELEAKISVLLNNTRPSASEHQPASLLAVPLFHATGSHAVYLAAYRHQAKLVSMPKWNVAEAAALIEKENVAYCIAPPTMTGDLMRYAADNGNPLASLKLVGGGGAPRAPSQVKGIDASFKNATPNTGWGMTETNAIGTSISGADYLERPKSSGRCSAVLEIRVVNEADEELPCGERGELQVRGASVFGGYWNRPDTNEESFVDGWFRSGDIAYMDEEGYLYIVDRLKDLVIRGGENIGCAEVEAALLEYPGILEAAVYSVPDERLGEEVGATLYCNTAVDDDDLRHFLHERLAKFKIPRYFHFCEEALPRIASGKIFKRQLREEAIARVQ